LNIFDRIYGIEPDFYAFPEERHKAMACGRSLIPHRKRSQAKLVRVLRSLTKNRLILSILSDFRLYGRTVLPYSQVLEREYQDWKKFRRGLRREDQAILDRLFDLARLHVQAGVYASRPWPLETILVSILIEQEKALTALRGKLRELEAEKNHVRND